MFSKGFILIIMLAAPENGVNVTTQRFNSQHACQHAESFFLSRMKEDSPYVGSYIGSECLPEG
jgi:hypothetical protein